MVIWSSQSVLNFLSSKPLFISLSRFIFSTKNSYISWCERYYIISCFIVCTVDFYVDMTLQQDFWLVRKELYFAWCVFDADDVGANICKVEICHLWVNFNHMSNYDECSGVCYFFLKTVNTGVYHDLSVLVWELQTYLRITVVSAWHHFYTKHAPACIITLSRPCKYYYQYTQAND